MKDEINSYFRKITPVKSDEEILRGVIGKAEEMKLNSSKPKFSFRKPLTVICAAAITLSLSITGAAAAGIINFNEIFDKRISVQDEKLGEALLCSAENFTYTISDDAYQIEMQGITGTGYEIIGTLVVSRRDGAPVTDYIEAVSIDNKVIMLDNTDCKVHLSEKYTDYITNGGAMCCYYTDNDGNLKIELNISCHTSMYGNKIHISCDKKYGKLPFDWIVEFTYIPSEASTEKLYRGYFTVEDKVPVTYQVSDDKMQEQTEAVETLANLKCIRLNCVGGTIEGKAELPQEWIQKAAGREMAAFDITLTKKDGSTVYAFIESGNYYNNSFIMKLRYTSDDLDTLIENESLRENLIAVDLSEIKSITINGKTFDMQ